MNNIEYKSFCKKIFIFVFTLFLFGCNSTETTTTILSNYEILEKRIDDLDNMQDDFELIYECVNIEKILNKYNDEEIIKISNYFK